MRHLTRVRTVCVLLLFPVAVGVLSLCAGCGGTPSDGQDDNGGTIVGTGNTTVTGTIVDAGNTGTGVANAYVYIPPTVRSAGSDASARETPLAAATSGANGSYTLQGVPAGSRTIVIRPPVELGYAQMEVDLDIPDSASVELRITLAKSNVASQVGAVAVAPAEVELEVGETQQFAATVFNGSGQELSLTPVWVANGDIGTVDEDGLFTATTEGDGYVVAVVAGEVGTARVTTVESTAGVTDTNLEAALRQAVGKPTGPLMIEDLEGLTGVFDAHAQGIGSLAGLEHCTHVTELYLADNVVADASPLSSLTNLRILDLVGNQIADAAPFSGLSAVVTLYLGGNQVTDLSPLAALGNLTYLGLENNNIADVSPLAGVTKLRELAAYGNHISDVSPLAPLTNLRALRLTDNIIADISPLSSLTNLRELEIGQNQIGDISTVALLVNLTYLDAGGNQVTDISPVASLTNLTNLQLWGNSISDVSPVSGLGNLTMLGLYANQIDDVTPLADLVDLTWLGLANNALSDLSPLSGLTGLEELYLGGNSIVDVAPLGGLTSLSLLELQDNQIASISPLLANAGLASGDTLALYSNPLDLSAGSQASQDVATLQGRGVDVQL